MGGPYRTAAPAPEEDASDEPLRDELAPLVIDCEAEQARVPDEQHIRVIMLALLIPASIGILWALIPSTQCHRAASAFPEQTSFSYPVDFEIGKNTLHSDRLRIIEVRGTAAHFRKDESYLVVGDYVLESREKARLSLTVISERPDEWCLLPNRRSQIRIDRGSGHFELATRMPFEGHPVLELLDRDDELLGRLYFR